MMKPQPLVGHAILALDPGTKLGWCLHHPDGTMRSGSVEFPTAEFGQNGRGQRGEEILKSIRRRQDEAGAPFTVIYFECAKFQAKRQGPVALMDRGGLYELIHLYGAANDCRVQGVDPTTVKHFAAGKGYAKKEDVKFIVEGWGFKPKSLDESDAIAVMGYALHQERYRIADAARKSA